MEKRPDVLDKNLAVNTDAEGFEFYSVTNEFFKIYGLYNPKTDFPFRRMPPEIADNVNHGVMVMNYYPAGGRIRFKTNAKKVAVRGCMPDWHTAANGTQYTRSGFDFYSRENGKYIFLHAACPPVDYNGGEFCAVASFRNTYSEMRDITVNLPLANTVENLEIGVPAGCVIEAAEEYTFKHLPVVYYGSSITMGLAASRPGCTYQADISRRYDWDYLNLGFSGNALGEPLMAEYIATLPMSVFVMDYDHNAPTPEHLSKTHYPFYKIIRDKQPDLPILMVTRPSSDINKGDTKERLEIVRASYDRAVSEGDNNVYFLNGCELLIKDAVEESLVDGCHPNDLGFYGMSLGIGNKLHEILEKKIDK